MKILEKSSRHLYTTNASTRSGQQRLKRWAKKKNRRVIMEALEARHLLTAVGRVPSPISIYQEEVTTAFDSKLLSGGRSVSKETPRKGA